ncbi:uncharacterized protein LOC144477490 [Augochlora pura]
MSRSICILFAVVTVLQTALASPVDEGLTIETKTINIDFSNLADPELLDDISPQGGRDLEVGTRRAGEAVYVARDGYTNNKENVVLVLLLNLSIPSDKTIHYVKSVNDASSQAEISGTEQTVGSSTAKIKLTLPPKTINYVTTTIGAH